MTALQRFDMMIHVSRPLHYPISSAALVVSGRTDLKYLQQFTEWFHRTFSVVEKPISRHTLLEPVLRVQMSKKQAASNRTLVYIFVCILRAMGIHCRLVLSFQALPVRPPSDELCSLSTKVDEKPNASTGKGTERKVRGVEMLKAGKVESAAGTSAERDELKIEKVSNSKGESRGTLKTNGEKTKPRAKRESKAKPKGESEEKGQTSKSPTKPKKREPRSKQSPQCDKEARPKLKISDESKSKKDLSKTSKKPSIDRKINLGKLKSARSKSAEPPEDDNLLRPDEKAATRSRSAEKQSGKERAAKSKTGGRAKKEVLKIKMPKIELQQLDGEYIMHSVYYTPSKGLAH